jgi:hypothetical protein
MHLRSLLLLAKYPTSPGFSIPSTIANTNHFSSHSVSNRTIIVLGHLQFTNDQKCFPRSFIFLDCLKVSHICAYFASWLHGTDQARPLPAASFPLLYAWSAHCCLFTIFGIIQEWQWKQWLLLLVWQLISLTRKFNICGACILAVWHSYNL